MKKKICVIGAGYWGKNHIKTLNELGCLYAIVEPDNRLNQKNQTLYPNLKFYSNLEEAIDDFYIDGFIIATPAQTHFNLAKKIILRKKPVLVEKPFTLNLEDAEELKNLAEINKTNVMVGHVLLFHPAVQKIKEIIDLNKIGKLQYIYSNRLNLGQIRKEENVFWSLAPHDISIFQYLTNSFPTRITSNGGDFVQEGVHDTTITFFEYPENVKAHIFVSWLHPFKEHRIVVIGSRGMITFEDSVEGKPLKLYQKGFEIIDGDNLPLKNDGPIEEIDYDMKMPLTEELKYFIGNMDKEYRISGIKNAYEVTKILLKSSDELKK
ncbi:MAG: oxidoreductase [Candidatus Marinimicrobia bacterium]|nr:oxidoreductase [Candidatus Neomarinimicrobiota bacterium]|tara:strand:- start:483 stop:1448 length:966 start_codon:yes stop_codon:yes gene_type:complete